jgi:hypothetical protein
VINVIKYGFTKQILAGNHPGDKKISHQNNEDTSPTISFNFAEYVQRISARLGIKKIVEEGQQK